MYSLLTGTCNASHTDEMKLAKRQFTAAEHHAAMRRLLLDASTSVSQMPAERLIAAARVHAEAAKTAGRTSLPVKTAPARTMPRDSDAL